MSIFRQNKKRVSTDRTVYLRVSIEPTDLRVETLGSSRHLVAPVVMLVEGVIHASNAPAPELALASEFGRFPSGWNGRPIVLDHPRDAEGVPVSANSPDLYDSRLGYIYNTRLEDKKLVSEVWLDVSSSAAADTINRINDGQTIEVSTGLFMSLDPSSGIYNNERYSGVWTNIVPDHLAVLSEGTIGACSVVDGCGLPRLNIMENKQMPAAKAKVDTLLANCGSAFAESDRAWLSTLTDEQIDKIDKSRAETSQPTAATTTTAPTQSLPTLEAYIASAPPQIGAVLTESIRAHEARRAFLVQQIRTNKANILTEEQLKLKPLSDLEGLAALAIGPDYSGLAGSTVVSTMSRQQETSVPVVEVFPRKPVKFPGAEKGGAA